MDPTVEPDLRGTPRPASAGSFLDGVAVSETKSNLLSLDPGSGPEKFNRLREALIEGGGGCRDPGCGIRQGGRGIFQDDPHRLKRKN